MPEFRRDKLSQRWIVMAGNRAHRPSDIQRRPSPSTHSNCPFCPGHESETPREVFAIRTDGGAANTPGWTVRVVPNKYPAVLPDPQSEVASPSSGLFERHNGIGRHEVIILSPDHRAALPDLAPGHLATVFSVCGLRLEVHSDDAWLRHAMLFYNHGSVSGASLSHPHFQLLASSVVPRRIADEAASAVSHWRECKEALLTSMTNAERSEGVRVIAETGGLVAYCPYASRFPYETWIVPVARIGLVEALKSDADCALARLILDLLRRVNATLNTPSFNLMFVAPPRDSSPACDQPWRIELVPRITTTAGYEWGSGCFINPVLPEDAARILRDAGPIS